jgi:ankyrin repeat protein
VVSLLIEHGAIFKDDCDGWSVLGLAILNGSDSMLKLLLEKGAEVTTIDGSGLSPKDWAFLSTEKLSFLNSQKIAKQKDAWTLTGLRSAAYDGKDVKIRHLLKNGADIDAKDDGGW